MVELQVSSYSLYFEIAKQNLDKATEVKQQLSQWESNEMSVGVLSGNIPDNELYLLFKERLKVRHFSIVSVIFSALVAEAFINHYGITKTSKNYFDYLDKLDLVAKWIIVPEIVTGHSIEPGSCPIQRLQGLAKLRNQLVHYKTRKVDIKTIDDWEKLGMASLDDAQNGIEAIRLLVKALNKLDESVKKGWLDDGSNPFMF